ncbi:unnamed protein product [Adineta ricciae]|uniref:G-protein coupled receptors family 1 profile domain-containing protein n=1 Tax=Adineta ricciae TaxID=249248 RepID=A0A815EQB6_ADIRI|nr:unnamed protein product [Adineta ricciae]
MPSNDTENSNDTLTYFLRQLVYIDQEILVHLPLIFIILGTIGFVGNAFTFLQLPLRFNSCCIYLLFESFIDIINLFVNLFPAYLNGSPKNTVLEISNRFQCKLKLFCLVFLPQLSINFLILSVIDRYACTCSLTSPIRYIRQLSAIPCIIFLNILLACLMSLYSPLYYDVASGLGCICIDPLMNGLLYILVHGISTPCVMLVFVLLTYRNVSKSHCRANLINRDRSRNPFVRMIFTQVLTTSFLILQWIIFYLYHMFTACELDHANHRVLHMFLFSLSNYTYYLINIKSFYLSTLTSRMFRRTFVNSFRQILPDRSSQRNSTPNSK